MWLSILKTTACPSPISTTPAFSPGPQITCGPVGGQGAQPFLGGFVGTMFVPHRRKDAKLGEGRLAADDLEDPLVFVGLQPVGCDQVFGDGWLLHLGPPRVSLRVSYGVARKRERGRCWIARFIKRAGLVCSDWARQGGVCAKKMPSTRLGEVQQGGKDDERIRIIAFESANRVRFLTDQEKMVECCAMPLCRHCIATDLCAGSCLA